MTTLYHPTLPSTVEVDDKSVGDWTDAGWRKSEPKAVADKPADPNETGNTETPQG